MIAKTKPRGPTPTVRELRYLRASGYLPAITEHWNAHAGIRVDLFGYVDVIALGHGGVLFVQVTSFGGMPARWRRMTGRDQPDDAKHAGRIERVRTGVLAALDAGVRVELHGWRTHERKRPIIRPVTVAELHELLPIEPVDPAGCLPF